MKRVAKSNKRVRKAEAVSNEKLSKNKEVFENGFFSKLIETKALLVLIILIFVIGIFAFKDYFLLKKLFFFKDIGSDSITQRYPQIVHNMNLLSEGFVSKWSFYVGMGQNYFTGFVTEPYGLLRKLIDKIGILFSEDYFVYAVFYKSFIFNILLIG
ncbi:MAG: hypothetical protein JXR51_13830, partial [Bacteroidales bacterium]|nr:hypothetical protein [Bacteroidales bacterium]